MVRPRREGSVVVAQSSTEQTKNSTQQLLQIKVSYQIPLQLILVLAAAEKEKRGRGSFGRPGGLLVLTAEPVGARDDRAVATSALLWCLRGFSCTRTGRPWCCLFVVLSFYGGSHVNGRAVWYLTLYIFMYDSRPLLGDREFQRKRIEMECKYTNHEIPLKSHTYVEELVLTIQCCYGLALCKP